MLFRSKAKKGQAFHQKTDIFKRIIWYSYEGESDVFIPLSVERVKEVMEMNKKGEFPDELTFEKENKKTTEKKIDFENVVGQDSLTRFDKKSGSQRSNQRNRHSKNNSQKGNRQPPPQQNRNNPNNNKN